MENEWETLKSAYSSKFNNSLQNPQYMMIVMELAYLIRKARKRFGKNCEVEVKEHVDWAKALFLSKDNVNGKNRNQ